MAYFVTQLQREFVVEEFDINGTETIRQLVQEIEAIVEFILTRYRR